MKTMKINKFPFLLLLILCAVVTACNNDDDDVNYSKSIVGAWYSEEEGEGYFFDGEGNGFF